MIVRLSGNFPANVPLLLADSAFTYATLLPAFLSLLTVCLFLGGRGAVTPALFATGLFVFWWTGVVTPTLRPGLSDYSGYPSDALGVWCELSRCGAPFVGSGRP